MSVTGAGVGSLLACVSEAEVTTAVWVGLLWFGSVVVGIGLLLAGLCSSAPPSERAGRDVAIANVVAAVLLGGWADAGEGYMTLEVLTCERCRTIEFRRPPDAE